MSLQLLCIDLIFLWPLCVDSRATLWTRHVCGGWRKREGKCVLCGSGCHGACLLFVHVEVQRVEVLSQVLTGFWRGGTKLTHRDELERTVKDFMAGDKFLFIQ